MKVHSALFMLGSALLLSAVPAFSGTYPVVTVGSCPGLGPFGVPTPAPVGQHAATIGAAVTSVSSGGVIYVCPGTYPEQVVITKPLTLTGLYNGTFPQIVAPAGGVVANTQYLYPSPGAGLPIAAQVFVSKTNAVTINGFWILGQNNGLSSCATDIDGIYFQNASGTVNEVSVQGQALASSSLIGCQAGQGIYVESGYGSTGSSTVMIQNASVGGYQKNGITGDGSSTTVTLFNDFVQGQGPTTGAGENGIQISDGAGGAIYSSTVINNIYTPVPATASGILIYSSSNVTVWGNTLTNNQVPIATISDPTYPSPSNPNGTSDNTLIEWNTITDDGTMTDSADGIDACSNNNQILQNSVTNTFTSGIHLDSVCGPSASPNTGKNDLVAFNSVNKSCAGILVGSSGDILLLNTLTNVTEPVVSGDACPGPLIKSIKGSVLPFPLCLVFKH